MIWLIVKKNIHKSFFSRLVQWNSYYSNLFGSINWTHFRPGEKSIFQNIDLKSRFFLRQNLDYWFLENFCWIRRIYWKKSADRVVQDLISKSPDPAKMLSKRWPQFEPNFKFKYLGSIDWTLEVLCKFFPSNTVLLSQIRLWG